MSLRALKAADNKIASVDANVGIIGCGAVTEQGHLPATARCDKVRVTILVDKNVVRVQNLAQQFNVPKVADDYTRILFI